jgi:Fe2+ transport system protein FeoA
MKRLTEIKNGGYHKLVVVDKAAPMKVRRRLAELGFISGQLLKIERKSLMGETYLIEIRGSFLSVRKDLAKFLIVE